MNERLKAWCERRMHGKCRPGNTDYYANDESESAYFYVRDNETWSIGLIYTRELYGKPTPEKCETICSYLGIRLRDVGPKGYFEDTFLLASHALTAADGIDPTNALALADEVQSRFRYPDITPEWLNELGWSIKENTDLWTHEMYNLRSLRLTQSRSRSDQWWWVMNESYGSSRTHSGPLAHRGDLLKLMELFGHDWKNPPRSIDYNARNSHQWDDLTAGEMINESVSLDEQVRMGWRRP